MTETRYLIVNADDLGQSPGVNEGIIEAYERGIVTSVSLMVRWPAAAEAAAYCRSHPSLSVGLHVDLGEWVFRHGDWMARYEVVDLADGQKVATEVERQIELFSELVGSPPTHIDSHQHVHLKPAVLRATMDAARRLGVPLRHHCTRVRYCGHFYGQDTEGQPLRDRITVGALKQTLRGISTRVTELACHPGYPGGLDSTYLDERSLEVIALTDPSLRAFLRCEKIELSSFSNPFVTEHAT